MPSPVRRAVISAAAAVCLCMMSSAMLHSGDAVPGLEDLLDRRVMVLGDSITHGGTYVSMISYELLRAFPTRAVDIVSIGLSSETTSGLTERIHPGPRPCVLTRLARALEQVKPQVVIACYGMNDGIYLPLEPGREEAFHKGIMELITTCQAAGAVVILLTPPVFDPIPHGDNVAQDDTGPGYTKPFVHYDEVLSAYAAWEAGLSLTGVRVIDLHRSMSDFLAQKRRDHPGFILSPDSIHPNDLGHLVMATAVLRGMGMNLPVDGDAELARLRADPLYGKVATMRAARSGRWLPWSRGQSDRAPVDAIEIEVAAQMVAIDALRRASGAPVGAGIGSH